MILLLEALILDGFIYMYHRTSIPHTKTVHMHALIETKFSNKNIFIFFEHASVELFFIKIVLSAAMNLVPSGGGGG